MSTKYTITEIFQSLPEPDASRYFFQLLNQLLNHLSISKDDQRLAIDYRKKYKGISVNINSRLVLGLYRLKGGLFFSLIVPEDKVDFWKEKYSISLSGKFKSRGPAALVADIPYEEIKGGIDAEILKQWLEVCRDYLPIENKSSFRIHHIPELYEIAKDPSLLKYHLDSKSTDPIASLLAQYKRILQQKGLKDEEYKWQLLEKFKGRPDISAVDFIHEITSINFSNLIYHNGIAVLHFLTKKEPEQMRAFFQALFDESLPLKDRMETFSANTLKLYRQFEPKLSHHQDERSMATYLTFHNPEKYTFFKSLFYKKYCRLIGIEPETKGSKYGHYLTLIRDLIENYINKDQELQDMHQKLLPENVFKDPGHLLLAQDILYQTLNIESEEPVSQILVDNSTNNKAIHMALNTILYGPPGTGKTYHTIDKALQIAAPHIYEQYKNNRKELTSQFRELLINNWEATKGQIAFTTFHQSMSYEDFVEGIKPDTSNDGEIGYYIEEGIFKKICRLASAHIQVEDNFNEAYNKLLQEIEENDGSLILKTPKKGKDFTIYQNSKGNLRFHANTDKAYEGVMRKEFIATFLQTGELLDWPSYIRSVGEYLINKHGYANMQKRESKNYVLIIDEINRGNVSQIFGELITLIEDDKRQGASEELAVTLPYSKKSFSVPANLYIIGTMNTADRSVEALDTALRRRFSFEEIMPKPDLLNPKQCILRLYDHYGEANWDDKDYRNAADALYDLIGIDKAFEETIKDDKKDYSDYNKILALNDDLFTGINLQYLLQKVNTRLEKLLTKDHQIGHAFFINVFSIKQLYYAFYQKLIPQLQEYFYGDFGKIGLVLGKSFIITETARADFAEFEHIDRELLAERKIYRIEDFKQDGQPDFELFEKAVLGI